MGLVKLALVRFQSDKCKKIVKVSDFEDFSPRHKSDFLPNKVYSVFWDVMPADGSSWEREIYDAKVLCLGESLDALKRNAQAANIRNIKDLFNHQINEEECSEQETQQDIVQETSKPINSRKRKHLVSNESHRRILSQLPNNNAESDSTQRITAHELEESMLSDPTQLSLKPIQVEVPECADSSKRPRRSRRGNSTSQSHPVAHFISTPHDNENGDLSCIKTKCTEKPEVESWPDSKSCEPTLELFSDWTPTEMQADVRSTEGLSNNLSKVDCNILPMHFYGNKKRAMDDLSLGNSKSRNLEHVLRRSNSEAMAPQQKEDSTERDHRRTSSSGTSIKVDKKDKEKPNVSSPISGADKHSHRNNFTDLFKSPPGKERSARDDHRSSSSNKVDRNKDKAKPTLISPILGADRDYHVKNLTSSFKSPLGKERSAHDDHRSSSSTTSKKVDKHKDKGESNVHSPISGADKDFLGKTLPDLLKSPLVIERSNTGDLKRRSSSGTSNKVDRNNKDKAKPTLISPILEADKDCHVKDLTSSFKSPLRKERSDSDDHISHSSSKTSKKSGKSRSKDDLILSSSKSKVVEHPLSRSQSKLTTPEQEKGITDRNHRSTSSCATIGKGHKDRANDDCDIRIPFSRDGKHSHGRNLTNTFPSLLPDKKPSGRSSSSGTSSKGGNNRGRDGLNPSIPISRDAEQPQSRSHSKSTSIQQGMDSTERDDHQRTLSFRTISKGDMDREKHKSSLNSAISRADKHSHGKTQTDSLKSPLKKRRSDCDNHKRSLSSGTSNKEDKDRGKSFNFNSPQTRAREHSHGRTNGTLKSFLGNKESSDRAHRRHPSSATSNEENNYDNMDLSGFKSDNTAKSHGSKVPDPKKAKSPFNCSPLQRIRTNEISLITPTKDKRKRQKCTGYMELGRMINDDLQGIAPLSKNGSGEVHIGNGVWVSEENWIQRYSVNPKFTIVTRELMTEIWGQEQLKKRSLTGVPCPANKKKALKAKATPAKINAVLGCSVGRLLAKGITDTDVIEHHIKGLRSTMREKFNESGKIVKPKKSNKPKFMEKKNMEKQTARELFAEDKDRTGSSTERRRTSRRRSRSPSPQQLQSPGPPRRGSKSSRRERSRSTSGSPGRRSRSSRPGRERLRSASGSPGRKSRSVSPRRERQRSRSTSSSPGRKSRSSSPRRERLRSTSSSPGRWRSSSREGQNFSGADDGQMDYFAPFSPARRRPSPARSGSTTPEGDVGSWMSEPASPRSEISLE